jgi:hypothetical protein
VRLVVVCLVGAVVVSGWQLGASTDHARDELVLAEKLLSQASTTSPASLTRRRAFLQAARLAIADARARLGRWPLRQLGAVPLLGRDVRLAAAAAAGGEETATAALDVVDALHQVRGGHLSGATLTAAAEALQRLADVSAGAARRVRAARPVLLNRQRRTFLDGTDHATRRAGQLAQMVRFAAMLYGSPRPVRLFLAFQNPAELRGTGGLIGQYGVLEGSADGPRLAAVDTYDTLNRRAAEIDPLPGSARYYPDGAGGVPRVWSSVNLAPHLPEVGRNVVELYRRTAGQRLDGVIVVDPLAVAEILKVSGPFDAGGMRITAANVATRTLVEAYIRFADDREARRRFLGAVAHQTFMALRRALARDGEGLARALAAAARGRHLQLFAVDPEVEHALMGLGLAGSAAAPEHGDYLLPIGVNTAGNKLDAFLHRSLYYDVTLDADGGARARVEVLLRNSVRPGGLPRYVVGPYDRRFRAGENRLYQTTYLAGEYAFSRATLDGRPMRAAAGSDVGALTLSQEVRIPAGRTVRIGYRLERPNAASIVGRRMRYELLLRPQATMRPDSLQIAIRAPDGWHFVERPPGTSIDRSQVRWTGLLDRERTMIFTLEA